MADFGISEIAAAASLAGSGASAIGALTQGNANADAANYAAQVAANNQTIASQNAAYAAAAGEAKAANEALSQRHKMGATLAGLAASGVDVNSGSSLDVRESQTRLAQQDVENVRSNAALNVYGYRTQASNFGAQAELDRAQASSASTGGLLKGLGGLLSSAPSFTKLFGGTTAKDEAAA